jgi:hypothetical protein
MKESPSLLFFSFLNVFSVPLPPEEAGESKKIAGGIGYR